MGLVSSPLGLAGRGIGAVGKGIGGARANATAVGWDLLGRRKSDPLDERDPDFIRSTLASNRSLAYLLHRPKVRGLENIPAEGPVLLVGNHSGGTVIIDSFVFSFAFYTHFGPERRFHQLAHDVAVKLPGLAALLRRYGGVPASHEYAERALEAGAAVLVYPGGDYESFRPSWHSGRIEFGGRSGWVRLALAQDVPIVPVVAIGGQESALFITRGQKLARLLMLDRLLRIKVLPIAIAPPFGLSFLDLPPRLPLPSQVTITVLPPIDLRERFGPEPDEDEVYEEVTASMQEALDALSEERDLPLVGPVWSDRDGDDDAGAAGAPEMDEDDSAHPDGVADVGRESTDKPTEVRLAPGGPALDLAEPWSPRTPEPTEARAQVAAEATEPLERPADASAAAEDEAAAVPDAPTVAEVAAREEPSRASASSETPAAAPEVPAGPPEAPAAATDLSSAAPDGSAAAPEATDPAPDLAAAAPDGPLEPLEAPGAPPAPPTAPAEVPSASPAIEEESSTLVAEFAEPGAEDGAGAELHVEEPWPGYSGMRVREVSDRLGAASNEALLAVQLYEQTHRSRRGVLDAVARELKRR